MSGDISKRNGKKGGRPKYTSELTFKIDDIDYVILTEYQYNSLIERYGYSLISKALKILERWLISSPGAVDKRYKNHYAFFRRDGWLINSALVYNSESNS